jgi:hypothetical protein
VRTPDGNAQNCLRGCIRRIKNIEDKDRSQIEQQMREISKIEAKVIPKKNERINDFCKKLDALKENVSSLRQTKSTFDSKLVARRV